MTQQGLAQQLRRAWLARGPLACALWPLALLYGGLLRLRRLAYSMGWKRSTRLPVPVVVVGNVVVGGAGKTPTVIGLVKHLRQNGWTPGVISRGHGGSSTGCVEVKPGSRTAEVGDEPALIARATGAPLVVGRQRAEAGKLLLAQHPEVDVIVCDDGMQHWALERDVTVVVFDGRGTGNGWLLPAGMLREPWPAKPWGNGQMLVLCNQQGTQPEPAPFALHSPWPMFRATRILADHAVNAEGRQRALSSFTTGGGQVAAMAGIAQPEAFFSMLRERGLALNQELALPDHADAELLLKTLEASQTGGVWLCTEKDAVKLFPLLSASSTHEVWAVPLEQHPEPAFFAAVDAALDGLSSAHGRQTP